MAELLEQAAPLPIHTLIGGIALPNPASVRLHEKFGFEKVGHFKEVGFKFNQWIDVGYWEKMFPDIK
jgi:phosphinothricin acetyltransferase